MGKLLSKAMKHRLQNSKSNNGACYVWQMESGYRLMGVHGRMTNALDCKSSCEHSTPAEGRVRDLFCFFESTFCRLVSVFLFFFACTADTQWNRCKRRQRSHVHLSTGEGLTVAWKHTDNICSGKVDHSCDGSWNWQQGWVYIHFSCRSLDWKRGCLFQRRLLCRSWDRKWGCLFRCRLSINYSFFFLPRKGIRDWVFCCFRCSA